MNIQLGSWMLLEKNLVIYLIQRHHLQTDRMLGPVLTR